jgi:hypothetical protein
VRELAAALLLLALVACGRDAPYLPPPKTSTTVALGTIPPGPSTTLIPSDASTPAAGTCGNTPEGGVAEIALNPDIPSPRCVIVHSLNQLRFVNHSDVVVTVNTGYGAVTLQPQETHLFEQKVGDYWEPGVHRIHTDPLYAGSGPEVWLQD